MRRIDFYKIRQNDILNRADFWNPRFEDLDLRLAAVEDYGLTINSAIGALTALALARLNDTFTPLVIEAQSRLNSLGASFSAESLSSLTIGTGTKTAVLTEATAENYVYTDYVSLRAAADPDSTMLGQVTSFDRPTKLLTVNVVKTTGAGTFADWLIRVGAPPDVNPLPSPADIGTYTSAQIDAAIAAAVAALPPISNALLKADNLSDLNDKAAARVALGLGALAVLSSIGYGDISTNVPADAAGFRTKAASKFLTPGSVWDAAAYVGLTDAATIAVDMNAGFNFTVTLGGNRTLGLPTNPKVGQSGFIDVVEPAGGGCTLGFQAGYTFDGGVAPSVDTAANRVTSLYYHARSATETRLALAFKGVR